MNDKDWKDIYNALFITIVNEPNINQNEGTDAVEVEKEEIDKVIEDEITQKLSVDLIQSIEMKFHVDLEKYVCFSTMIECL